MWFFASLSSPTCPGLPFLSTAVFHPEICCRIAQFVSQSNITHKNTAQQNTTLYWNTALLFAKQYLPGRWLVMCMEYNPRNNKVAHLVQAGGNPSFNINTAPLLICTFVNNKDAMFAKQCSEPAQLTECSGRWQQLSSLSFQWPLWQTLTSFYATDGGHHYYLDISVWMRCMQAQTTLWYCLLDYRT